MVRAPAILSKSSTVLIPPAGRSGNGCPGRTGMAIVLVGPLGPPCAMNWPDTSSRRPSRVQDIVGAWTRDGPPPDEQKEHNTRVGSPWVDIATSWEPAFAANVARAITHSPSGDIEKTYHK